jgi:hypothetical protein
MAYRLSSLEFRVLVLKRIARLIQEALGLFRGFVFVRR